MAFRNFFCSQLGIIYLSSSFRSTRLATELRKVFKSKFDKVVLQSMRAIQLPQRIVHNHGWKLFCNTGSLMTISLFQSKDGQTSPVIANLERLQSLLSESDQLHTSGSEVKAYSQLIAALASDDPVYQCAEVLWRAARGARAMANATHNESTRKSFTYEAFEYAKRGLELEPNNAACHKWMGILLELTGRYEGTKKRIENSYLVRDHFQKAAIAKPDDAVVLHCLGAWCFEVADLPWYQRKLAAAFFATPPASSYDEALKYLLRAEEVDPNFYSCNLLYIGKAYLRKGDTAKARDYLQRTLDYRGDTVDDKQSRGEAAQLLKSL